MSAWLQAIAGEPATICAVVTESPQSRRILTMSDEIKSEPGHPRAAPLASKETHVSQAIVLPWHFP